uniref:Wsv360-like protein n=1 Tax=Trachysalambria curvirostris nimavirus TaxID=2984282 RepID=A0A9C7C9A9_9VIRU|nr:MAG: wsv360-like protein [Trachysalambria curvirostris nimavirus]
MAAISIPHHVAADLSTPEPYPVAPSRDEPMEIDSVEPRDSIRTGPMDADNLIGNKTPGLLERCISTSCWVGNLLEHKKPSRFRPLESIVTHDGENITPSESIIFVQTRPESTIISRESPEFSRSINVGTRAVTSLRAASEIIDSLASSSLLQYSVYSKRNLIPLFLSSSKCGEYGGRTIKSSTLRRCFAKEREVDGLLRELNERKINAAKAFANAVREKSVVNTALAAWNSGNAACLQRLVEFSKLKYGPRQAYKTAGLFRPNITGRKSTITTVEFMAEVLKRHRGGTLNFDSAPSVFNTALSRVFNEFRQAVETIGEDDKRGPLFCAVRQRRVPRQEDCGTLGMLTPRRRVNETEHVLADRGTGDARDLSRVATGIEMLREGRKRNASTGADELRDTLAYTITELAINPTEINTTADLQSERGDWEWSMHITQLFAQAFLETMSSLLSCVFDIRDPFSDEGFESIANVLRKREDEAVIDINPSILADEYLLLTGNFQIPFHVSDTLDVVEGRQVCPNTPVLTIIKRYNIPDKGVITEIELRDRLLVKDALIIEASDNTMVTSPADRNTPTSHNEKKKPMLGGCVSIIRGPLAFQRNDGVDDVVNSLANDWYVSTGVYYSIGKNNAAICAGLRRAIASARALCSPHSRGQGGEEKKELRRLKTNMRRNADSSTRLSLLLGQTVSAWGHQEHNATIDSFWSSSAALQSKTTQDALARSKILGVRRQLDRRGHSLEGLDDLMASEQTIRDTFYQNVQREASYDIDSIVNLPLSFTAYEDMSDEAQREWPSYILPIVDLTEEERRVFNVKGLFSCLARFRFPLVSAKQNKNRRTNLMAANRIINGLTEMTIQASFNATPVSEVGVGIGSAADGWSTVSNQLEPSRMRALKAMARYKRESRNVISVPVSRSRGSVSGLGIGVTAVDIPMVIIAQLISDKQILDALSGGGDKLTQEIGSFIETLSGGISNISRISPIFTDPRYSIIFLRYVWLNTAIISITDTNIIPMALSEVSSDLGAALYRDYLSIRALVNDFHRGLHEFSIDAVTEHYLCSSKKSSGDNFIINDEKELHRVLHQTSNALSAFTNKVDGVAASADNMRAVIGPLTNAQQVKNTSVSIEEVDKLISPDKLIALMRFLRSIGSANSSWERHLRSLAIGKHLTKKELSNFSPPDIALIFSQKLGISEGAIECVLGSPLNVVIDLNVTHPIMIDITKKENLSRIDETTNTVPALKNTIIVPGHLTPTEAKDIIRAFTSNGANSNKTTHMGLILDALDNLVKVLEDNINDNTMTISIEKVGPLACDALLTCLVSANSKVGRHLVNKGVHDLSRLLINLLAEASLAISRLQSSFYPLPPSLFSMSGMFRPDKFLFDDIAREYTTEIIKELTKTTSRAMSGRCDDRLISSRIYNAGKAYNEDNTPVREKGLQAEDDQGAGILEHLKNPTDVWSPLALSHFDVAVVPRFQVGVAPDQVLKLSSYYQGMHKLSRDPGCKPEEWDKTLPGNNARGFYGLREVSDNTRSFNSALDTVIASPADICDLVTRETVRSSTDVVHNIGSHENKERMRGILAKGFSAVRKPSSSSHSLIESSIKDTISALSRDKFTTDAPSEGHATAHEIAKTWNIFSLLNRHSDRHMSINSTIRDSDVVRVPLVAMPDFRQNVTEATRSVYELATICSVIGKNEKARDASRKVMEIVENTSPVLDSIGIDRVASLVSTVATPRQHRRFMQTVSDYRNSLVKLVNISPFSGPPHGGPRYASAGLHAVYDGMLYSQNSSSSAPSSLSDRFWMGFFNRCPMTGNVFGEDRPAQISNSIPVYGSRVNTYAAISSNIDRLKESIALMDRARQQRIVKSISEIEEYILLLVNDSGGTNKSAMNRLVDAQHVYSRLSNITAESIGSNSRKFTCGNFTTAAQKNEVARHRCDAILRSMLHNLATLSYSEQPKLATRLAMASHIIVAKEVYPELRDNKQIETLNNLLAAAGVTDYSHVSASALCRRLKADDIKMFLGGTMLEQGLFVTFLLNNIIFNRLADTVNMESLENRTKSILVKLLEFCETVSDAMNARHARRRINMSAGGTAFTKAEAKVDASFVSALYSAHIRLRKDSDLNDEGYLAWMLDKRSLAASNDSSIHDARVPLPKRSSTLLDILKAPSSVHKSFMTSFSERAAASRQVMREGGALLSSDRLASVYGTNMLTEMRASHSYFTDDHQLSSDEEDFANISEEEDGLMSTSSDSDIQDTDSSEGEYRQRQIDGHSYDALEHLDAIAKPLSAIYGHREPNYDLDSDNQSRESMRMRDILMEVGESESEDYEDEETYGMQSQAASRRRSERLQYGPGFLSHSFLFNHPYRARTFLTQTKRFKNSGEPSIWRDLDDEGAIFSDASFSSDDDYDYSTCGYGGQRRRRSAVKRKTAEDQCAFVWRVMRAFVPTRINLVNGRVSLVTPASTDTASSFFEAYQKASRKEREKLRKDYNITAGNDAEADHKGTGLKPSPTSLRRSLIKASAYTIRTQTDNAEIIYDAIMDGVVAQSIENPSRVLSEEVLFSKDLREIIKKRNYLLSNLTEVSSSLFNSSVGRFKGTTGTAVVDNYVPGKKNITPGYLGVPLYNLAGCLRAKAADPSSQNNTVGITVDSMLAIKDRSHLDWLTTAALVFARSYNITTPHALEATLKTASALSDMYNAFAKVVSSQRDEKIKVNSTLLDSIFNVRMAHVESIMGLICPTAFINHEMPADTLRRKNLESVALAVLRGVNSDQLSDHDIGDTSGLLTFLTSQQFAGHGGERGGLSLYRMSITDSLSCRSADSRLKGAVSLDFGKWKMCDNSVFSRRSKDLVEYCSKRFIALENAVGPIARFIPDGTEPDLVGLPTAPPLTVSSDPAMLRLENVEGGCGASGRFITASAIGNLYGTIDNILNLAKKFAIKHLVLEAATIEGSPTIEDIANGIIQKMKVRRNKSLAASSGKITTSQATNYPVLSDAIVLRAKEMRNSITTIVSDLSSQYGIIKRPDACSNSSDRVTKVSVRAFERILETSAVLANTKMTLRGIENRLASALTQLDQFKRIATGGLSESKAVMTSIAEALNTLDKDEDGGRYSAAELMGEDGLYQFIVDCEIKNISEAKRHVTMAVEGACHIHARLLGMLASTADIISNDSPEACQILGSDKVSASSPMASNCGTLVKHPDTGLWLKTDENCNTAGTASDIDHKRVAHSIMRIIHSNRDKALRSKLYAMCRDKYSVSDIFVLDDSDMKSIDNLIEKLGIALANKAGPDRDGSTDMGIINSGSAADNRTRAATSVVVDAKVSNAPLGKKIPYIPVIFENRQEEGVLRDSPITCTSSSALPDSTKEQSMALRHLEIQESNDLSNILSIATKHKFVTHNQAATVAIFSGNLMASSGVSPSGLPSIMSRLPSVNSPGLTRESAAVPSSLSPSSTEKLRGSISRSTVIMALREYATKMASELSNTQEYRDLKESKRKMTVSLTQLEKAKGERFFIGGIRQEIDQSAMSTLTQSQSAKDGALELFMEVLRQLEIHSPGPSISTVSLPLTAISSLPAATRTQDNNPPPTSSRSTSESFIHAYQKLSEAEANTDIGRFEKDAAARRLMEQEVAVRVPLLLSSPEFSSLLRDLISDFGEFYSGLEQLKRNIADNAKDTISQSFLQTDRDIAADKNLLTSTITELAQMYSNEADAIKVAIKTIENKVNELELQNDHTASNIKFLNERIEMGDTNVGVNDMLNYGSTADGDQQLLRNLKSFAGAHSGSVFTPSPSNDKKAGEGDKQTNNTKDSYRSLTESAVAAINKGQSRITVSFDDALTAFPKPLTSYSDLNMQMTERQQQNRLTSVKMFIGVLEERVRLLRARLSESSSEGDDIDRKKQEIDNMFTKQTDDRYADIKNSMSMAEAAVQTAMLTDLSQSPLLMSLSGRLDRVLFQVERVSGDLPPSSQEKIPSKTAEKSSTKFNTEHSTRDQVYNACFMSPLHETIKRITAIYDRDHRGPLSTNRGVPTSEADLQLMSIVDLCESVLKSSGDESSPYSVPSSIVPGLCRFCAMVVTNLHEATHESSHSFNFEEKRSREKLKIMLNAILSGPDVSRVRYDVLAMIEGNNGHVKEFSFTHCQKVACMTPVNTLIGEFLSDVRPSTVLLPTSELFSCPGVDNDKFRSIVYRSVDKTVADAPKASCSIAETLARTPPNAEKLFFPFKDQRRHFNSITDAVIANMNSEATCQLNTTCDQNLVKTEADTGLPIFVGRRDGKARVTETVKNGPAARGGMPGCSRERLPFVDLGTKFMVAPGSLLNANKEETLRLNKLSDINNVRHYGTDVHVAGANSAWRIGEIIGAASTCSDSEEAAKKLILLGSVSALAAQKAAHYSNDPTAMLNTTSAVQSLVSEVFPSPTSMAVHVGAAETAFATQLAYRQRLFPSSLTTPSNASDYSLRPLEMLSMIRRYDDAYSNLHCSDNGGGNSACDTLLKQSVANVPVARTPIGAYEEASLAASNNRGLYYAQKKSEPFALLDINRLAVEAMTDTVVDMFSAVSTMAGSQRRPNRIPPYLMTMAASGNPANTKAHSGLLEALSRAARDASLVSQMNGPSTAPSLFSFPSFPTSSSAGGGSDERTGKHNAKSESLRAVAAERVLTTILNGATEVNKRLDRLGVRRGGAGRAEAATLYRNAMTSILKLNEDEITREENIIESKLEKRQMREAFSELKKAMLISHHPSSSLSSSSSSLSIPLSVLLSRDDAASGLLRDRNTNRIINAVDEFNISPLLVRHLLLDPQKTPVPVAKEVRGILIQPKGVTARALLSEASPLLTELCLYNTRDTHPERAVDRLLASIYLVKQAKRFDGVDPLFPAALTGATHLMLSSIDSRCHNTSPFLDNIKLHMNDTTCFLKNIERYEKLLGRYGDSYSMSHRQNCNCPFALHHDFRPSADEHLISSFAYARPEVTVEEIRDTPYQANKLLSDKHYVMAMSKIDTRITGSALLKKISEWTDMRMTVNFSGAFEPSRLALSNSGMTTAGVNLDVVVRPNNAKNVMGILECHRDHVCALDAKSTIAACLPSILHSTRPEEHSSVSELVQNALPHNRYIQKSTMSAPCVIFANILEQLIRDLGNVIIGELAGQLATSVSETVYANSKSMIDSLGSDVFYDSIPDKRASSGNGQENESRDEHLPTYSPLLVSQTMKNAVYQSLIAGKMTNPENVPFASSASGPLAYDFLMSREESNTEIHAERGAAASLATASPETSRLRNHLAHVFEAISKQVSDFEFSRILEDIETKIKDDSSHSCSSKSSQAFGRAIRQEFDKVFSFLKILRQNITPMFLDPQGKLAEKVAVYLYLLSTKSRLENLFQYGLSNSSSVDLSHLKPVNCSNNTKNIEDTFMYRNVHPVIIMALPENFTALLQQEQYDAELAIENRRPLTTFLNHPNTISIANSARATVGAGGGNPLGLYVSSHILHESTISTSDPVTDTDINYSFYSPVTQDPMMVLNPFKDSAKLRESGSTSSILAADGRCFYLQVSMPTEFSGLVTNTGIRSVPNPDDTFKFTRRDNTPILLPKITPSVLCSDASLNLLDNFSRADVTLRDVNLRFGFMPEIISAIAHMRGTSVLEITREMSTRTGSSLTSHKNASVDPKTGDVLIENGTFPDVRPTKTEADENKRASDGLWGGKDKQKLHARVFPAFLAGNPLASASVNGVPVTYDGFQLAEEKRKKAAGITYSFEAFGSGCIGTGALRAAANSRLVSDLEPLRKGWEEIIKLQGVFSKAAADLKKSLDDNRTIGHGRMSDQAAQITDRIHTHYMVLKQCREILQQQTSLMVATSDMVTGGYAGDPSAALVNPVRGETLGLIGAISAPIRGLGHLLNTDGVAAVNAAIRNKLTLSTSYGRLIPEHGVVYRSSDELLTDADSIYRLYSIDDRGRKMASEGGDLGRIMSTLSLSVEGRANSKGTNTVCAAKHISSFLSSPEYENETNLAKRRAIIQLLVSNPDLLRNTSNTLFYTTSKNSISPLRAVDKTCALIGDTRETPGRGMTVNSNNVTSLNRLFSSRLR